MADRDSVTLPGWFVKVLAGGIAIICTIAGGAIPWAWRVDNKLTELVVRDETRDQLWAAQLSEIKRRIEVLESRR